MPSGWQVPPSCCTAPHLLASDDSSVALYEMVACICCQVAGKSRPGRTPVSCCTALDLLTPYGSSVALYEMVASICCQVAGKSPDGMYMLNAHNNVRQIDCRLSVLLCLHNWCKPKASLLSQSRSQWQHVLCSGHLQSWLYGVGQVSEQTAACMHSHAVTVTVNL